MLYTYPVQLGASNDARRIRPAGASYACPVREGNPYPGGRRSQHESERGPIRVVVVARRGGIPAVYDRGGVGARCGHPGYGQGGVRWSPCSCSQIPGFIVSRGQRSGCSPHMHMPSSPPSPSPARTLTLGPTNHTNREKEEGHLLEGEGGGGWAPGGIAGTAYPATPSPAPLPEVAPRALEPRPRQAEAAPGSAEQLARRAA